MKRKYVVNLDPQIANFSIDGYNTDPNRRGDVVQTEQPISCNGRKGWQQSLNALRLKLGCGIKRSVPADKRTVWVGHPTASLPTESPRNIPDNRVVTSKYTLYNFLPKNLFEQFRRMANFYFLCVALIQVVVDSPVSPLTSFIPLFFVISVTAIKQGYEDWLRHRADNEVNNRPVTVVKDGKLVKIKSRDVRVGDIVKVNVNESFPCDLILISSSEEDGQCHLTTANLDGETNLKVHWSVPETARFQTPESLVEICAKIECGRATADLYKFEGKLTLYPTNASNAEAKPCSLGYDNILLKGARLKNTDVIYGCAIFTGQETKMSLNSKLTSNKFSTIEKSMNYFLIIYLFVLLFEVTVMTSLRYGLSNHPIYGKPWYRVPTASFDSEVHARRVVSDMFSYLVLYNYIIPISMYVTIEMQKFLGTLWFVWDEQMYDEETNQCAICNTSDLNEELGQVEYLFTDKTGTLTENDLQFRHCSINGLRYMEMPGLGMLCQILDSDQRQTEEPSAIMTFTAEMDEFFVALALCHTVHVHKTASNGEIVENCGKPPPPDYHASSPDEKALVEASQRFGIVFGGEQSNTCCLNVHGIDQKYERLHVLEFDSDRKCMSVIVRDPQGQIILLCKGAEIAMLHRVTEGLIEVTMQTIDDYALMGLRTLMIASRKVSNEEYNRFSERLLEARLALEDRDRKVLQVFETIERDLRVLGATAIEDRLQDGVPETLEYLSLAGIKVWILTGDKEETAVNISYSCGHFKRSMKIIRLTGQKNPEACMRTMIRLNEELNEDVLNAYGMVVDGVSLAFALCESAQLFYDVSSKCQAVVCCRMSPMQKALVVTLIKDSPGNPITAAIGDGANDVSMIQEAHVGLGLMGKEGRQAVRCSDFAFARFRFLLRAFLVHGHYYYVRVANLMLFFFYKNIAFITPGFYYGFFASFSDQPLYDGMFLTAYNILFTSAPIFIYGLGEQNIKQKILQSKPQFYQTNVRNAKLTTWQFFKWNMLGLWHANVLFFGTYFLFGAGQTLLEDGQIYGNWEFGTVVMQICVFVVNLKLCVETRHFGWVNLASQVASLAGFIAFTAFWNRLLLDSATLYWVYFRVLSSGAVWMNMLLLIVTCLIPDFCLAVYETHKNSFYGSQKASPRCFSSNYSSRSDEASISHVSYVET